MIQKTETLKNLPIFCILILLSIHAIGQPNPLLHNHSKIFIVRHAEKLGGDDPLLTTNGNKRAGDLMRILKKEHIHHIYVTEFKRTQHTADSLRIQLGIDTIQVIADTACIHLFNAISRNQDWDHPILIITHSNIIPKIIFKLGDKEFPQQNIPDSEFDNLYILRSKNKQVLLQQLKYGMASAASATMKQ